MTPDRWGYRDSADAYAFCADDPANNNDPTGTSSTGESLLGFFVGVGESAVEMVAGAAAMPIIEGSDAAIDTYTNLSIAISAYRSGGGTALLREVQIASSQHQYDAGQKLLGLPIVNTVVQASKIGRAYDVSSFEGGRQVGRTTFSLGSDVALAYGFFDSAPAAESAAERGVTDVTSYETPFRQLSKRVRKQLEAKVEARTITREEWARLRWDQRFARRRASGVSRFWAEERIRLRNGEAGTRSWSPDQRAQILSGGRPTFLGRTIIGHHTYSAMEYPHLANNPSVIYPVTFMEHWLRWHNGTWGATHGAPLNPLVPEEF